MAANLAFWEVDPFFAAAEEVQNSADRMESAFRTWQHSSALAKEGTQDVSVSNFVDARKRDLITSLDTARWQLEEFEQAVKLATRTEQVYLGEDAPSRHRQFIHAIRSQLASIENILGDDADKHTSRALCNDIKDEDRECLAQFLCGSILSIERISQNTDNNLVDKNVFCAPSELHEVREIELPQLHAPSAVEAINVSVEARGVNGAEINLSNVNGFHIRENGLADAKHKPVINGVISFPNGYHRCASASNLNSFAAAHSDASKANFRRSDSQNGLNLWGLLKGKRKLKFTRSLFKRWKDGDATIDQIGDSRSPQRNGCMLDIEQGKSFNWLGIGRIYSYSQDPAQDPDEKLITGCGGCQHHLQLAHQSLPYSSIAHVASAVAIVFVLVATYFWFLSTLVPYDNPVVPGNFLD